MSLGLSLPNSFSLEVKKEYILLLDAHSSDPTLIVRISQSLGPRKTERLDGHDIDTNRCSKLYLVVESVRPSLSLSLPERRRKIPTLDLQRV